MTNSDFPKEAYEKAARYCAINEHCRQQVVDFLLKRKLEKSDIETICQQLEKEGFVDNLRFAKLYVISKLNQNSWGKIKIRFGLKQLQISEQNIAEALESIAEEKYVSVLQKVLQKATTAHPDKSWEEQQKVVAYAVSKGFEMELILKMMKTK
ncbi:MAG: regulatory protein RecX [Bacteroidales bacterium]|nr:regulatory protein RecX [Bacteroidales bacterium]